MNDKPSFLKNIGDDKEEKEIISVLEDEPETPTEETPTEPKPNEEKPIEEKPVVEEKPKDEKPVVEEKPKDEKPTDQKPVVEEKPKDQPLILGKYKTQAEFEKAHNELQKAFNRIQNDAKKRGFDLSPKKDDELAPFKKMPIIRSTIPDPTKYYVKNEKGEEVLDLGKYMQDTLNNFAVAIQRNMLGGPLSAAIFSMLGKAIGEEQGSALEANKREEAAVNIWNNVQKAYPILGKDARLQGVFERAIYGEKQKRRMEAEKNKTEFVDMVEEDYLKLANDIVGAQPGTPAPQEEEPTEKPKGDVALKENTRGATSEEKQVNDDIEGMMKVKRKSLF